MDFKKPAGVLLRGIVFHAKQKTRWFLSMVSCFYELTIRNTKVMFLFIKVDAKFHDNSSRSFIPQTRGISKHLQLNCLCIYY